MNNISSLKDTIIPKSDQLNSEQLLTGPITITVTGVSRGSAAEQPISIHYDGENGRPYKPCKTMRKVLIFAWGDDGNQWIGKSMTLYNQPDVKFGGVKVGGIRISHLSDIASDISISLTSTRGKKDPVLIKKLEGSIKTNVAPDYRAMLESCNTLDDLKDTWKAVPPKVQQSLGKDYLEGLKLKLTNPAAENIEDSF